MKVKKITRSYFLAPEETLISASSMEYNELWFFSIDTHLQFEPCIETIFFFLFLKVNIKMQVLLHSIRYRNMIPLMFKYRNITIRAFSQQRTEQNWIKFLNFSENASKSESPMESNILPVFVKISELPDIKVRLKSLLKNPNGYSILTTILNLYMHLTKHNEAFYVLKLMSPKMQIKNSLQIYPQLPHFNILEYTPVIDKLSQSMLENIEFLTFRLKILNLTSQSLIEKLEAFESILETKNIPEIDIYYAFDIIIKTAGILHYNTNQVYILFDRRKNEYNLPMRDRDYLLLMLVHFKLRQFDKVVQQYKNVKSYKEKQVAIYYTIRSYLSLGYAELALQLLKEIDQEHIGASVWKALLTGFSKYEISRKDMDQMLDIYRKMMDLGLLPDKEVFHTVMNAFSKRKLYDDVLLWHEKLLKVGYKEDEYTYSILDGSLCNIYTDFDLEDSVKDILIEKFENILGSIQGLQNNVSLSQRILIMTRRKVNSYNEIIEELDSNPNLRKSPELFVGILSFLIKQNSPHIEQFIQYIRSCQIEITGGLYSLFILGCRKPGKNANYGWEIYEEMKKERIIPTESCYRNLVAIGFKTNDQKRIKQVIKDVLEVTREVPVTRALYRDLIYILTSDRYSGVTYEDASLDRLIDPFIEHRSELRYDSGMPGYGSLAFDLFISRVDQGGFTTGLLPIFYRITQHSTIHKAPNQLQKINKFLNLMKENTLYPQMEEIFYRIIIKSNDWKTSQRYLKKHINDTESMPFKLLEAYFREMGHAKNVNGLYTAFVGLFPILTPYLISVLVEQLGIYARNQDVTKLVWEMLEFEKLDEEIIWAYVRSLVWCGYHSEAVQVAKGLVPKEEYSGRVVVELRKWLKLNDLSALELELVEYWKIKKPQWVSDKVYQG
jgi:tetratricopeptide (TPR) repeat protein